MLMLMPRSRYNAKRTLDRKPLLISQQLQLNAHVCCKSRQKAVKITESQETAVLRYKFHFLLKYGSSGVSSEDEECAHWSLAGV